MINNKKLYFKVQRKKFAQLSNWYLKMIFAPTCQVVKVRTRECRKRVSSTCTGQDLHVKFAIVARDIATRRPGGYEFSRAGRDSIYISRISRKLNGFATVLRRKPDSTVEGTLRRRTSHLGNLAIDNHHHPNSESHQLMETFGLILKI